MPKIDIDAMEWTDGSVYPGNFKTTTEGRSKKRLGDAVNLSQFGVNITRISPGSASSLRHWHEQEDEFVFILQGEIVLVEDEGETLLRSGDAAGFKAGVANGHHLINRSNTDVVFLEVGTRAPTEKGHYPDDDLAVVKDENGFQFTSKSGAIRY